MKKKDIIEKILALVPTSKVAQSPALITFLDSLKPEEVSFVATVMKMGKYNTLPGNFNTVFEEQKKREAKTLLESLAINADLFEEIKKGLDILKDQPIWDL